MGNLIGSNGHRQTLTCTLLSNSELHCLALRWESSACLAELKLFERSRGNLSDPQDQETRYKEIFFISICVPAFAGNVSCDHTRIDCETPIFYTREVHPGNSEIAFVVNGHPSIDSSGCLTFGLQANFYGKVQFGVALSFAGSQFQSNLSFFSISVIPVNDKPVFLLSSNNIHVSEDDFSARTFTQPGFISESFLEPFSQLDLDQKVSFIVLPVCSSTLTVENLGSAAL